MAIIGVLAFGWIISSLAEQHRSCKLRCGLLWDQSLRSRPWRVLSLRLLSFLYSASEYLHICRNVHLSETKVRHFGFLDIRQLNQICWSDSRANPCYKTSSRVVVLVYVMSFRPYQIHIGHSIQCHSVPGILCPVHIVFDIFILFVPPQTKDTSIPEGSFRIGQLELYINHFVIVYGVIIFIFLPFLPTNTRVRKVNMNYSRLVFGLVLIFSLSVWFVRGRRFGLFPHTPV